MCNSLIASYLNYCVSDDEFGTQLLDPNPVIDLQTQFLLQLPNAKNPIIESETQLLLNKLQNSNLQFAIPDFRNHKNAIINLQSWTSQFANIAISAMWQPQKQ